MTRRSESRAWLVASAAMLLSLVLAAGYFYMLPLKEKVPYLVMADDYVLQSTNGTGLFAVQGALNDPAHHRIHLDKMQAAAEPIQKSTVQVRQEIPTAIYAPQQEDKERRPMGV
jgi:type IV secretion system protein VirB8